MTVKKRVSRYKIRKAKSEWSAVVGKSGDGSGVVNRDTDDSGLSVQLSVA